MLKVFLSYIRIILVWKLNACHQTLANCDKAGGNVAFKIKYSGVVAVPSNMNTQVVFCTATLGIDFALGEAAAATNCSCRRNWEVLQLSWRQRFPKSTLKMCFIYSEHTELTGQQLSIATNKIWVNSETEPRHHCRLPLGLGVLQPEP